MTGKDHVYKNIKGKAYEGKNGTGIRLKLSCGFCGAKFRAQKERNKHTSGCSK
jgi:hypothetical protein